MGITRDSYSKRRKSGAKKAQYKKKRKFNLGRPAANTKLGPSRVVKIRVRGGNSKYRALRLDVGNFSWGSQGITHKSRIHDVVYNATNNELVRTKTLVKNCIVQIDALPFKNWFERHFKKTLDARKKEPAHEKTDSEPDKDKFPSESHLSRLNRVIEEQLNSGKIYACISSRPGQSGRCDGYILEGRELEFYVKKIKARKAK